MVTLTSKISLLGLWFILRTVISFVWFPEGAESEKTFHLHINV